MGVNIYIYNIYIYIYIYICVTYTLYMYVVKEVTSFRGLSQLMGTGGDGHVKEHVFELHSTTTRNQILQTLETVAIS